MGIKITLFITFLLYAAVISQSFFYILAMSKVMKGMQVSSYIETRQLLDKNLRPNLGGVYYATLLASIALTALCVTNPSGLLFGCSIISLLALIVDLALTVKGNLPINREMNNWTIHSYPKNWNQYRRRWMSVYQVRQAVNLTGFIILLAGMVFGLN